MKTYTVYFSQEVCLKTMDDVFDKNLKKWVYKEVEKWSDVFVFHSLAVAKKFIKQNLNFYKSSVITKTWSNGDWENLGEIVLKGNNKKFVANTKQKKENY